MNRVEFRQDFVDDDVHAGILQTDRIEHAHRRFPHAVWIIA